MSIDLTRFIIMFSDSLELASPGMSMHQTKAGFIGLRIAEALGMPRARKRDLVYACLLHDIGALSPEEKSELHSPDPVLVSRHCRNGGIVLSRVPLMERCARLVERHHDSWKGHDSDPDAFDANIIHLADSAELEIDRKEYILFQHEGIRQRILKRRGSQFAPEIADAFELISRTEEFWLELASPRLPADFADDKGLVDYRCTIPEFAPISTLVRDIIDFRSHFTATHSSGVSAAAAALGAMLGFSDDDTLALAIAGNLHDIGKMALPNAILLKPGPLDARESAIMRQHPYHTNHVLGRAGLPSDIVEAAAWHHERLDGTGYPVHAAAPRISLGARVLSVADVFTALAEERPYRASMPDESVKSLLESGSRAGALEPAVVGLLLDRYADVVGAMREARARAADFYASKVAC